MNSVARVVNPVGGVKPSGAHLSISEVSKVYDPEGAAVQAVDKCSFEIEPGEICMLVGPSGCGKTTLLNAVAGFHGITSGTIHMDGERIAGPDFQATPGSDRIVVFQNGALFPWKTNLENVAFGPIMQGTMSKTEAFDRARELMADAGVGSVEESYPGEISSGMRRRVEIVRALINDPKVLLLDEPYRALDSLTKSVMHEALLDVWQKHKVTIFFITHDLEEAIFLGSQVAIMTTRPCQVKKRIKVDIPYPRDYSVLSSERFRELVQETNEAVHEEARHAFEAGEKEG